MGRSRQERKIHKKHIKQMRKKTKKPTYIGSNMYFAKMCGNKIKYINKSSALQHLMFITKNTKPMRAYKCPYCKCWHLTSKVDF